MKRKQISQTTEEEIRLHSVEAHFKEKKNQEEINQHSNKLRKEDNSLHKVSTLQLLSKYYLEIKEYINAEATILSAINLSDTNKNLEIGHKILAQIYFEIYEYEAAIRAIDVAIKCHEQQNSKTPEYYSELASYYIFKSDSYFKLNLVHKAESTIVKVLYDHQEKINLGSKCTLKKYLALAQFEQGKFIQAEASIREAIFTHLKISSQTPDGKESLSFLKQILAKCLHKLRKHQEAIMVIEKAYSHAISSLDRADCNLIHATFMIGKKEYSKGNALLNLASDTYRSENQLQKLAECQAYKAKCFFKLFKHNKAITNAENAIQYFENNPGYDYLLVSSYETLSSIFIAQMKYRDAFNAIKKAIKISEKVKSNDSIQNLFPKLLNTRAKIYMYLGNYNDAYTAIKNAMNYTKKLPDTKHYINCAMTLSQIYNEQQYYYRAESLIQEILLNDTIPDSQRIIYLHYAECLLGKNQVNLARNVIIENLCDNKTNTFKEHSIFVELYFKIGSYHKAIDGIDLLIQQHEFRKNPNCIDRTISLATHYIYRKMENKAISELVSELERYSIKNKLQEALLHFIKGLIYQSINTNNKSLCQQLMSTFEILLQELPEDNRLLFYRFEKRIYLYLDEYKLAEDTALKVTDISVKMNKEDYLIDYMHYVTTVLFADNRSLSSKSLERIKYLYKESLNCSRSVRNTCINYCYTIVSIFYGEDTAKNFVDFHHINDNLTKELIRQAQRCIERDELELADKPFKIPSQNYSRNVSNIQNSESVFTRY